MFLAGLTFVLAAPVDGLFALTLLVASPEILLAVYAEEVSLKLLSCFSISVLILLIFLDLYHNLCKVTHDVCLFCCEFLKNVGETPS